MCPGTCAILLSYSHGHAWHNRGQGAIRYPSAFAVLLHVKTVWPSGLRRWLKAPFRKGVGSNPTAVICHRLPNFTHGSLPASTCRSSVTFQVNLPSDPLPSDPPAACFLNQAPFFQLFGQLFTSSPGCLPPIGKSNAQSGLPPHSWACCSCALPKDPWAGRQWIVMAFTST